MKRNSLSISLTVFFSLVSFLSFYSNAYPAASSYYDTVQKIYMGYYQRPADPSVAKPTFTADVAGTYILSLVVNDGKENSVADTVNIASTANTGSITVKW